MGLCLKGSNDNSRCYKAGILGACADTIIQYASGFALKQKRKFLTFICMTLLQKGHKAKDREKDVRRGTKGCSLVHGVI